MLSLNVSQFRNAECGQEKREMSGVSIVNSGALTQVHEANKNYAGIQSNFLEKETALFRVWFQFI